MHNSPCCRQGHADLTRTVSGASDAEPDGIKHIEPIDRVSARESKEQCEKLQVVFSYPLLILIMYLKCCEKNVTNRPMIYNSALSLFLSRLIFRTVRYITRQKCKNYYRGTRVKAQNFNNILEMRFTREY